MADIGRLHIVIAGRVLMLVGAVLASGCGPADGDYSTVARTTAPGGRHEVLIESAHGLLAYSAEHVRVWAWRAGSDHRALVLQTQVANDGGGVLTGEILARWLDATTLHLCLSGDEQQDVVHEIDLSTGSHSLVARPCGG